MIESWPENEVRKVSRVWKDPHDGRTWLVVFDLANLSGRVECVGVAIRSSLGPHFDVVNPLPDDEGLENDLTEALWRWTDPLPADGAAEGVSLQPVVAETLRHLAFAGELRLARRDHADSLRLYAEEVRAYPVPWATPEDFEAAAAAYETPSKAGGRRSKYSVAFLQRVATLYQAACEDRMDPPAKRVERELGLTPDVARKLIRRCRDPRLRLLPPAAGPKARGWLPGERDEQGAP